MTAVNRIQEIFNSIHSFSKETYIKEELLPEYLELEKEMVNLTFNDSHAENGNLNISDVQKHLEGLNRECGNIADIEMELFKKSCNFLTSRISAERSGNKGEEKVFEILKTLKIKNKVLTNVKLKWGTLKQEIDAVVFTKKAVFIIEVKNHSGNIYIDEKGFFIKSGGKNGLEGNICEKMNMKEELLRRVLVSYGYHDVKYEKIVVFTNPKAKIDNKCQCINHCLSDEALKIISEYPGESLYYDRVIKDMMECTAQEICQDSYPAETEIISLKMNFANIMTIIEAAAEKRSEDEAPVKEENERSENQVSDIQVKDIKAKDIKVNDIISENTEIICSKTDADVSRPVQKRRSVNKPERHSENENSGIIRTVSLAAAFGAGLLLTKLLSSARR